MYDFCWSYPYAVPRPFTMTMPATFPALRSDPVGQTRAALQRSRVRICLQALIAGCGITAFVYHNSAAALVNGLFCAALIFGAAYTSHYHYRKYA